MKFDGQHLLIFKNKKISKHSFKLFNYVLNRFKFLL